jgi:hypothetical protein
MRPLKGRTRPDGTAVQHLLFTTLNGPCLKHSHYQVWPAGAKPWQQLKGQIYGKQMQICHSGNYIDFSFLVRWGVYPKIEPTHGA